MTPVEELKSLLGARGELRAQLEQLPQPVPGDLLQRLFRILELIATLLEVLQLKNLSIARLRTLCFGAKTEKSRSGGAGSREQNKPPGKRKGHGRKGRDAYTGARRVPVKHPGVEPGQVCPDCTQGKLRVQKKPAAALRMEASPPVQATIFELERLRCDVCGKVFTAPAPPEAGKEKYDPSVGVMLALLRYGSGMPHLRLERLQQSVGVPLPASVQWEQVDRTAQVFESIIDSLIEQAAQSETFYTDDTTMRVRELRARIQSESNPQRTGIFTTAIAGMLHGNLLVLYFTGIAHAGENFASLLDRRDKDREPPLHSRDGLAHNQPEGHETIGCGCNTHARRKFVEIETAFPEESRKVIDAYAQVYRVEAEVREHKLDAEARLKVHQTRSGPVMEELNRWMKEAIEQRQVEPNSALGGAIGYCLERWEDLTRFLEVPGAPLDNNLVERLLKAAILHRKSSMFYKTCKGAAVGDRFMSLIQTCAANAVNPFDYLMAVVKNAETAGQAPKLWLPWNYKAQLPGAATASA